jgi:phosphonopyruvate decarboxylase
MQNSGLGNAVNPLTSLMDTEVYSMPALLLIGWRGEPGHPDEPQHVKQGRISPALLDTLEIPWHHLHSQSQDPHEILTSLCRQMYDESRPVALLISANTFADSVNNPVLDALPLTREQAIQMLLAYFDSQTLCVSTTGKASRELYTLRAEQQQGHAQDFLTVGSMGHTSALALGLAIAQPQRRIVCLDGDGALLMHMGNLSSIGQAAPPNLIHIVLNNGAHDSVGGQPTVAMKLDLPAIARACGYNYAHRVHTAEDLHQVCLQLFQQSGPQFLEIQVSRGARKNLGRPQTHPIKNRQALMQLLSQPQANGSCP